MAFSLSMLCLILYHYNTPKNYAWCNICGICFVNIRISTCFDSSLVIPRVYSRFKVISFSKMFIHFTSINVTLAISASHLASHSHTHTYITYQPLHVSRELLVSPSRVAHESLVCNSWALVTLRLNCTVCYGSLYRGMHIRSSFLTFTFSSSHFTCRGGFRGPKGVSGPPSKIFYLYVTATINNIKISFNDV